MTVPVPSENADPKEVAAFLRTLLSTLRLRAVLVGTSAALATNDLSIRSKDTDVLGIGGRPEGRVRSELRSFAAANGLEFAEPGWGVMTLRRRYAGDGEPIAWAGDVILPRAGMIPRVAANRIYAKAVKTKWGLAACPEHVIVMKAVAAADRAAEGDTMAALKYEQHLALLGRRHGTSLDEGEFGKLLKAYPPDRRRFPGELIQEYFGIDPLARPRAGREGTKQTRGPGTHSNRACGRHCTGAQSPPKKCHCQCDGRNHGRDWTGR
ncbi:MAG: hypothetical protein ACYDDF_03815 [Thermoplasmatota archaeon]